MKKHQPAGKQLTTLGQTPAVVVLIRSDGVCCILHWTLSICQPSRSQVTYAAQLRPRQAPI